MMKSKIILLLSLILWSLSQGIQAQEYKFLEGPISGITAVNGIDQPVTVKVIYDNYIHLDGLQSDWGFSILVEGLDKTILFDTGTKPDIFASNFKKMGLDASEIDFVVLSHEHGDHIGGIPAFVEMKKGIPVLFPQSFSDAFKKRMIRIGLEPVLVKEPAMICKNLYTSGEFECEIPEQCLVLNTKHGLVVMTGCSHPGIIRMLKEIKEMFNKDIYMVFGGFHLMQKSEKEMDAIIAEMKALGVVKCGATHCTGDKQIQMFKDSYGENYFELGVGNVITIE